MKYSFCFLLFLLLACAKGDKPQISIAPVSPSFEIEASENLLVKVYDVQQTRVVDTFLANTDFFLYELSNTVAYPLQLRFKAVQNNPDVKTYPVFFWRKL